MASLPEQAPVAPGDGFEALRARLADALPGADLSIVDRAYAFGRAAHAGQYRASGEPFYAHPVAVAGILADLEMDPVTIAAALLHDVVEDTTTTVAAVQKEFGPAVATLVDGVTKLTRIEFHSKEQEQVENYRKMFLAMARDIRVLIIKLADRLHNMRTLEAIPEGRRRAIAEETLDVYAPLAHRLGMFRLKMELEDLALRHLHPGKYQELARLIAQRRVEREGFIARVVETLRRQLDQAGIEADIQGRAKHFYSIYRKMYEQGRPFEDIYDLLAVRIIVDSVRDCYAALGIVHALWKPIPGRFKDFIAVPKANRYQSLHTTVAGAQGQPFEIQIRTWEMHRTAEYGIAAHWKYKEGTKDGRDEQALTEKLAWIRQLLEWQQDIRDSQAFMENLKVDLFEDEVFVFTPKGDVIELPAGATPIDFAYRIHTEIGHRTIGARVNGRIVPLDTRLSHGDIVEIITSKAAGGPSWDWLNIAVTAGAKSRIRGWFKKERREENIARGREVLEREARRLGFDVHELLKEERLERVLKSINYPSVDDLVAAVGYGGVNAQHVLQKLREDAKRELKRKKTLDIEELRQTLRPSGRGPGPATAGVRVKGIDNVLVRFARCCNPIPGDPIAGYITRGRGVSIHRADCANLKQFGDEQGRMIDVSWDADQTVLYPVGLQIHAIDRPGLLSDVVAAIADTRTNMSSVTARTDANRLATIELVLEIRNQEHVMYLVGKIGRIRDVMSVTRMGAEPKAGAGGTRST